MEDELEASTKIRDEKLLNGFLLVLLATAVESSILSEELENAGDLIDKSNPTLRW